MGKARNGSVRRVLVEDDAEGTLMEFTTKEAVEEAIFNNIHRKRFYLAETAPACNGRLRGLFGYNAATVTAERILNGSYEYPDDFDQATREICEECAKIRLKIPKDSMNLSITSDDWMRQWKGRREATSSSESGLHFGHYIAGCASEQVAHLHALKSTLVINNGVVMERWARGLSVMLEKLFGCALITKLRSILLMEADFNATNKIVYGDRMLHNVRKYKMMPEEIYSEKNRLADDGTLVKVLFYDIVRQTRLPAGISAVDADNCWCGARQCGSLSNTAPAPPLVFSVPFFYIRRARRDATTSHNTKKPAKHRDHGGRAALLSSDVELMVRHNRTCGRPVHGVGRGHG
jgi:hypothetical protein